MLAGLWTTAHSGHACLSPAMTSESSTREQKGSDGDPSPCLIPIAEWLGHSPRKPEPWVVGSPHPEGV